MLKQKQKSKAGVAVRKSRVTRRKKAGKATAAPVVAVEEKVEKAPSRKDYIFAVGRRKSSVARTRYYPNGTGEIRINNRQYTDYFPYFEFQRIVREPLDLANQGGKGTFSIKVSGGGTRGQAESIRLGISRILLLRDEAIRPLLKSHHLLTRDPRTKERKKYGLKKARRAPQWQKR